MITLSKKLSILFIASSLFWGMQGMEEDPNWEEVTIEGVLPEDAGQHDSKEELELSKERLEERLLQKALRGVASFPGSEQFMLLILNLINEYKVDKFDIEKTGVPFLTEFLKRIESDYQTLSPVSRKAAAEVIKALADSINKHIAQVEDKQMQQDLQKLLEYAKPIVELIDNNRNAGLIAQFSLLDLSGKVIVGLSLPLTIYGLCKAVQALMPKDEFQEELR